MVSVLSMLVGVATVATSLTSSMAMTSEMNGRIGGDHASFRSGGGGIQRGQEMRTNVIVTMREKTDGVLNKIRSQKFSSRDHRVRQVRDDLEAHASSSQRGVFDILGRSGSSHTHAESFWLTNQVFVHGATPELIRELEQVPDVMDVSTDQVFPQVTPVLETANVAPSLTSNEWNINKVKAPQVWASDNTGEGVVVGVIDTGVRASHHAIRPNFREQYGWFDPETRAPKPYDATGHGTHVTGIVAGNNGIGVAPGVSWIACKGCRSNGCYLSDLLACFQFMLCPSTPDGSVRDCSKAPQVVNNSWGGGQGLTFFDSVIQAWHAAGIIPVFAAGNRGPHCGTTQSPADHPDVIAVGASDFWDGLAFFSARGPTIRGLRKPDISAPGTSIRSACWTGDADYCTKSGTSMASPHVAGAIALYIKANPGVSYDHIKQVFQSAAETSTVRVTWARCGNIIDNTFPNNHHGYGRLDVSRSLTQ